MVGLLFAAVGWPVPIMAAAAQSLAHVAVMLNSSRLLRVAAGRAGARQARPHGLRAEVPERALR